MPRELASYYTHTLRIQRPSASAWASSRVWSACSRNSTGTGPKIAKFTRQSHSNSCQFPKLILIQAAPKVTMHSLYVPWQSSGPRTAGFSGAALSVQTWQPNCNGSSRTSPQPSCLETAASCGTSILVVDGDGTCILVYLNCEGSQGVLSFGRLQRCRSLNQHLQVQTMPAASSKGANGPCPGVLSRILRDDFFYTSPSTCPFTGIVKSRFFPNAGFQFSRMNSQERPLLTSTFGFLAGCVSSFWKYSCHTACGNSCREIPGTLKTSFTRFTRCKTQVLIQEKRVSFLLRHM